MISEKDAQIISHLRNNARTKITEISRKMHMPVTTVYDRVKAQENNLIKRYVPLIDFAKFGLHVKIHLAIRVERAARDALQQYLVQHIHVNSIYRIDFGYDFLAECLFKDILGLERFTDELEVKFPINEIKQFQILQELKKEDFLSKPEHLEILN